MSAIRYGLGACLGFAWGLAILAVAGYGLALLLGLTAGHGY
jgi:hypothetical protein